MTNVEISITTQEYINKDDFFTVCPELIQSIKVIADNSIYCIVDVPQNEIEPTINKFIDVINRKYTPIDVDIFYSISCKDDRVIRIYNKEFPLVKTTNYYISLNKNGNLK